MADLPTQQYHGPIPARMRFLKAMAGLLSASACVVVMVWLCALPVGAAPAVKRTLPVSLKGAGSLSAAALYEEWAAQYEARTGVRVDYDPSGTRAGIYTILTRSGDFGAVDRPLLTGEYAAMPGVVMAPTTVCSVAVIYNVPGVEFGLHLTGSVLAGIYLGKITRWNDARIRALNPKSHLPDLAIAPWFRAEGGAPTATFTRWLSQTSPPWASEVGSGFRVRWPLGSAASFEGISMISGVLQTPGAIGYEAYSNVARNVVPYARLRNRHGQFVLPSPETGTAAAKSPISSGFPRSLTGLEAKGGYPLCAFTYLLLRPETRPELKAFLQWALTSGAKAEAPLGYSPLPPNVTRQALAVVDRLKPANSNRPR